MYPRAELTSLASSKSELRQRIFIRRSDCAAAAARLAQPIVWIDRAYAAWRRISPMVKLAAVPIGLLIARLNIRHLQRAGAVLRWGPLVLGAVRSLIPQRGLPGRG
jgi:hypothetical protein